MIPKTGGTVALSKESLGPNPVFFVEALQVIPGKHTSLLRIYNALEQSKNLAGRLYHSATRNRDIPLFEEAVRIEGPDKIRSALPDPPPAAALPSARENYIRLKDANFGACYYAISFATDRRGIRYRIQNFKPLTFGPFPVMKAQGFTALFYLEPVEEGLALYCLVGAEVSDFIGRHVNMSSALDKRLDVLIEWLLDGIR
jgi:hypothetical protein